MKDQHRTIKVISALVVSMTIGAFVLIALDDQPLADGPFSLKKLSVLAPVRTDIAKGGKTTDWDGVEVYYNDDSVCDFDRLVSNGNSQLHFAIGNAGCGKEGFIEVTSKWKSQKPCSLDLEQGQKIIRICIINDAGHSQPSNLQVSRATQLVEKLSRLHHISPARIRYPVNWQI
ncbi:MAG: hypothetical protein K9M75_05975 [Phycisphaerae bacterium]|nr:hypothetical protein [Phycisphaerae bacterium]